MHKENSDIKSEEKIECGESFAILFADMTDGTLSEEKAAAVRHHMENCEKCAGTARLILQSRALAESLRAGRDAFLQSADAETTARRISSVMEKVYQESLNGNQTEKAAPARKRTIVFFAGRHKSWIYAAAGFVVLFFGLAVFFSGIRLFGTFAKRGQSERTNDGYYGDSTACAGSDMQNIEEGSVAPVAADDSGKGVESQKAEISDAINDIILSEAVNPVVIAADCSSNILKAMKGSVLYYEITNTQSSYTAIAAYPSQAIQSVKDDLTDIGESKLKSMGLAVKIEIISGENSRKLVEYTGRETVASLQKSAEADSADFLVITINR